MKDFKFEKIFHSDFKRVKDINLIEVTVSELANHLLKTGIIKAERKDLEDGRTIISLSMVTEPGPKQHGCKNCGAPLKPNHHKCEFCNSPVWFEQDDLHQNNPSYS